MGVNLVQCFSHCQFTALSSQEMSPLHLGRVPVCSLTQWTSPSNLNPPALWTSGANSCLESFFWPPHPNSSHEIQSHKASVRAEYIYSMICEEKKKKQLVIHLVCPRVLSRFSQLYPALCDFVDCSPPSPWDSPGKNTGVGYRALLQGIFLTQG